MSHLWGRVLLCALACLIVAGARSHAAEPADAETLLQSAIKADMDGDASARSRHLRDSLRADADYDAARWYSGQLKVDDRWTSVDEFERGNLESGKAAQYAVLRNRFAGSLPGQISLATWCRKNGLLEREKLHWSMVLQLDPKNKTARQRLGVREYRGMLVTTEQYELARRWQDEFDAAKKHWTPRIVNWRKALEGEDAAAREAAVDELCTVRDAKAVPFLEKELSGRGQSLEALVINVLGVIEDQTATNSLVRHAVFSEHEGVRRAAASQLADRSWYAFVPGLLGNLQAPLELKYYANTLSDGAEYGFRLEQEKPSAVQSYVFRHRTRREFRQLWRFSLMHRSADDPLRGKTLVTAQTSLPSPEDAVRGAKQLTRVEQQVRNANARLQSANSRIYDALELATSEQIDRTPQAWWKWWQKYNELQQSEQKPELQQRYSSGKLQSFTQYASEPSCFMPGTIVWTDTGARAIENVAVGDRVLSQDQNTGRLAYQVVLGTTLRPPSPTLRVGIGEEEVVTTPGHPFWVSGKGWRMAKHLEVGDRLHCVRGSVVIKHIKPGPESQAHNLIVDRFSSYFVGSDRILVHDNRARYPTHNVVPGFDLTTAGP